MSMCYGRFRAATRACVCVCGWGPGGVFYPNASALFCSFNIDFPTARHTDSKNVPGSWSCLCVFETGPAFQGGFYMLPQFAQAFDAHHGSLVFHRSGDADVGVHCNSTLALPGTT